MHHLPPESRLPPTAGYFRCKTLSLVLLILAIGQLLFVGGVVLVIGNDNISRTVYRVAFPVVLTVWGTTSCVWLMSYISFVLWKCPVCGKSIHYTGLRGTCNPFSRQCLHCGNPIRKG